MATRNLASVIYCSIAAAALVLASAGAALGAKGQGSDLEIGGPGEGQGKFRELRDITFDSQNRLFVLCGARMQKGKKGEKDQFVGSLQVQWFDNDGKYLGEFSVRDETLGEKNNPMRLAVDGQGNVYVTQPTGGFVQRFSPEGKLLGKLEIKGAYAITSHKVAGAEQIVVVPNLREEKKFVPVEQLPVIKPNGDLGEPVRLSQPVGDCQDITADAAGNLYLLAAVNQIYKFDAAGKLQATLGGGTTQHRGRRQRTAAHGGRGFQRLRLFHDLGQSGQRVAFQPGSEDGGTAAGTVQVCRRLGPQRRVHATGR